MTTYHKGGWNAICDQCGFEFKSFELKKRWDGLMVCSDDWEPRHPQDYVRAIPDKQNVPWTRPVEEGIDVSPGYVLLYIEDDYFEHIPWLFDNGVYYNQDLITNLPNIYYANPGYWDDTYVGTSG